MSRRDWLLLAIGSYIEPIQLQKTLFKFAMEAQAPAAERYDFVAYNWGPCANAIYDDLALLRSADLVRFVPTGRGWNGYRLTSTGESEAQKLREQLDPRLVTQLDEKREWVTSRSFRRLLVDVYAQYPQFAERSLFKS